METEIENQIFPQSESGNQVPLIEKISQLLEKINLKKPRFQLSKKKLLLLTVIAVLLLVLALAAPQLRKMIERPAQPTPSPTPIKESVGTSPSAYATDSAVLEFEKMINEIERALKETAFQEPALLPPEIDLKVDL